MIPTLASLLVAAWAAGCLYALMGTLQHEDDTRHRPVRHIPRHVLSQELLYHGRLARHYHGGDWSAWDRAPAPAPVELIHIGRRELVGAA